MGVYVKALVVTTLLMEIATLVSLTAVWAVLTELHVASAIVFSALVLTGVMLIVPARIVFRLAVRAEHRMVAEARAGGNALAAIASIDPLTPPNLLGSAQARRGIGGPGPAPEIGARPDGR